MTSSKRLIGPALVILALLVAAGVVVWRRQGNQTAAPVTEPAGFEARLRTAPDDRVAREAALMWYSRHFDLVLLRSHTLELIAHHPASVHIFAENEGAFYADPAYRKQVIKSLEEQVAKGQKTAGVYGNLAIICRGGALPGPKDPAARRQLLAYLALPADTPLPNTLDEPLVEKAIGYFRSAAGAQADDGGPSHAGFYVTELADLLLKLGRAGEARDTCRDALRTILATDRADLLVIYGRCQQAAGENAAARRSFVSVRDADREGEASAPGHATVTACTELGLMALTGHDLKEARRQLFASCQVQPCAHTKTNGLPLTLARALLRAGDRAAVATFCRESLRRFNSGHAATRALLAQAEPAASKPRP